MISEKEAVILVNFASSVHQNSYCISLNLQRAEVGETAVPNRADACGEGLLPSGEYECRMGGSKGLWNHCVW